MSSLPLPTFTPGGYGAALPDQDVAGQNELTVAPLHAQTLGLGVAAVAGGANALFMGEKLQTDIQHVLHLQNGNMIGIFLRQLDKVDHEGGQKGLAGALVGLSQIGGEFQCDGRVLLPHLDGGLPAPARR